MSLKVLILGGTAESRVLGERLAGDARFHTVLSFAGRTRSPQLPNTPSRVGGFGGVPGLIDYLQRERIQALVDATHPFASQMSAHAVLAARATDVPLLRLERAAWQAGPGDQFIEVPHMHAAALALGQAPRRVFLSVGRLEIAAFAAAAQHSYLIRAVDAFDPRESGLSHARVIAARGPFALADERELLERERIEILVSKNSGTDATYAKILAARALQLPVIMLARPPRPAAECVDSLDQIVRWLEAQAALDH